MKTTLLTSTMAFGLALSLSLTTEAQPAYDFSTFTAPYAALQGGTAVSLTAGWDDPEFNIPLGFDFQINGQTISELTQLGLGAEFGVDNNDVFSTFGLLTDLADNAIAGGPSSTVSYATSGIAGSRICKIDYVDAGFYGVLLGDSTPTGENIIDFQIWLYEGSSALEIRFGESTISDPDLAYEGLAGPLVGFLFESSGNMEDEFIILDGDPENPDLLVEIPQNLENLGLTSTPASGRVYRFAPDLPTSLSEADQVEISIYPTLAVDAITVKSSFTGKKKYQIFDITGKEVMNGLMSDQERIQVSQLHAGVYLFALEGSAKAQKFVKQ